MANSVLVLHRSPALRTACLPRRGRWFAAIALTLAATGLIVAAPAAAGVKVPVVNGVSPAAGKTAGHNVVTVTGSSFDHVSRVLFGSSAGSKIHVISSTKLTVVAPRHAAGVVDVRVEVMSGSTSKLSAKRSVDRYHFYAPPIVAGVSPSKGSLSGGNTVTVTGSGFRSVTRVEFGTTAGTHTTVKSTTRLTVVAPKHETGTVDVIVLGMYGRSAKTSKDRYRYSSSAPTWHATEAPLPAHAKAPESVTDGVACSTSSSCVAVGNYLDASSHQQGLIDMMSGQSWTGTKSPVPAGAGADPHVSLTSAACEASGSCVAVGSYIDHNGHSQGLLEARKGSKWAATEAPLPSDANSAAEAQLTSVACAPTTTCVAIGSYPDTNSEAQGVFEKLSGGTWGGDVEVPLPSGAGADVDTALDAISCPTSGNCVAVGSYLDGGEEQQGLIEVLSSGSWHAVAAPLPSNANSPFQNVNLYSVSCASAGACVAVGKYVDNSGDRPEALIETISGQSATPLEAPLPSNSDPTPDAVLGSVSCLSGSPCVAVGNYLDKTVVGEGLLESIASPGSATASQAPGPASSAGGGTFSLESVACEPGACTATGFFSDRKGAYHAVIDSLAHSKWTALQAPLPANNYHGTSVSPELTDLTETVYAGDGTYVAIGEYPDKRTDTEGLIDSFS